VLNSLEVKGAWFWLRRRPFLLSVSLCTKIPGLRRFRPGPFFEDYSFASLARAVYRTQKVPLHLPSKSVKNSYPKSLLESLKRSFLSIASMALTSSDFNSKSASKFSWIRCGVLDLTRTECPLLMPQAIHCGLVYQMEGG
jgi:hypothetical protein